MRVVTWNCQMAFRKKFEVIEALEPDILVIPESESPEFLAQKGAALPWVNHVWVGENPTKGLSVFARAEFALTLKPSHEPSHRFVVPVEVTGPEGCFDLYAFWTQAEKTLSKGYVTHALNAVSQFGEDLRPDTLLLGDFNSSPVFKQNGRKHVEMVDHLAAHGFSSLYHRFHAQDHGAEDRATFFLHRHRAKPYHLDYIFCHDSQDVPPKGFRLGDPDDWLHLSDHMPLIADFGP